MATAKLNTPPPVPQPPSTVTLELSIEEASVLLGIVGKFAGPDSGPRGKTSSIFDALNNLVPAAPVRFTRIGDQYVYLTAGEPVRIHPGAIIYTHTKF